MTRLRFTKANLVRELYMELEAMCHINGFDLERGEDQVRTIPDKSERMRKAFLWGEVRRMQRIIDRIEGGYLGIGLDLHGEGHG